jgi:dihydrofolate reductase
MAWTPNPLSARGPGGGNPLQDRLAVERPDRFAARGAGRGDLSMTKKRPGMRISLIVAMAQNRVIGKDGTIPWKIPGEQQMFRRITLGHTLVMGRKTHEDIGRPLPDRLNIVVSRRPDYRPAGCLKADSLENALALCPPEETEVFIIGGGELFRESIPIADRIYLTVVPLRAPGDTFFPEIPDTFAVTAREHVAGPHSYALNIYDRIRVS